MIGRSSTLRSSKFRARQRKVIFIKVLFVLFFLVFLLGGFYGVGHVPAFQIQRITVAGVVMASQADIASTTERMLAGSYFYAIPRANTLVFPKERIVNELQNNFPRLAQVAVSRYGLHELRVAVRERVTVGVTCAMDTFNTATCFDMDAGGFLFAEATSTAGYIVFEGTGTTTPTVGMHFENVLLVPRVLALTGKLQELGIEIVRVRDYVADGYYAVTLSSGARLLFASDVDDGKVLENLTTLVRSAEFGGVEKLDGIDYIDLRFGNKVFYKRK